MSISELTGKIFTNSGKEVIIFSLLAGNEGGGHIKYVFLSLSLLTDASAVAEVTLTICQQQAVTMIVRMPHSYW